MFVSLTSRRSGNVLAFALMGLVALLAIALVLFSRARREAVVEPASSTAVNPETVSTTAADGEDSAFELTPPAAEDDSTTAVHQAPAEIQLPPPPPPVSTPDNRDLPPEG